VKLAQSAPNGQTIKNSKNSLVFSHYPMTGLRKAAYGLPYMCRDDVQVKPKGIAFPLP
jgi:hypothetical protein